MIYLTDRIVLAADDRQYIVGIPKQREGLAKVEITSPRYYSTLSGAVQYAITLTLRQKVKDNVITDLRECVCEIERLTDDFENKFKALEAWAESVTGGLRRF